MSILVINAGSSSFKYQLFSSPSFEVLCSGLVERIGESKGKLIYKHADNKHIVEKDFPDHKSAMSEVIKLITSPKSGVIKSKNEIEAIGHRVVMGGEELTEPCLVDTRVKNIIRDLAIISPLHNFAHLTGIEVCEELLSGIPNVTVFDSGFHQTMPDYAYLYPVEYKYYTKDKLRKFGFHGTSCAYVSAQVLDYLALDNSKIILCHLGNGCSITALKNGKSIDTSMGLAPLEGLMMGTRCGDIDPTLPLHIMRTADFSPDEMTNILNKQSGLKGICGLNDMRDIHAARANGDEMAELAFKMFCYRIKKYIGSYYAILGGLDALVFTAGIGENDEHARAEICKDMQHLGLDIDLAENDLRKNGIREINKANSKTKILIVPTNEELEIAIITNEVLQTL